MEIIFLNSEYLWGLVAVPIIILIHFLSLRFSRAKGLKFANYSTLVKVSDRVGSSYNLMPLTIRTLIFVLIIFAMAGTTLVYFGQSSSIDYVLAVDVSSSMSAQDFYPNRLEAAKVAARTFVDEIPLGSSAGVIGFSGVAFINSPLTSDKFGLRESINGMSLTTVGGTDISSAIISSTNLLIASEKPRVIILLTDGKSNIGIPKEVAVDYANQNRVLIYSIGIGEREGVLGVDEEFLSEVSTQTSGEYFYAENEDQLMQIYSTIARESEGKKYINMSLVFIFISLFLLALDWWLINTIYSRIP